MITLFTILKSISISSYSVIAEKLGIKLLPRDLRLGEPKAQLKAVLGQWLPVDRSLLEMVVRQIPAPNQISDERAQHLLCPTNTEWSTFPPETRALKEPFRQCDAQNPNIIIFVSKVSLPEIFRYYN